MSALYYATVTLHVLAAMVWLGGMLFLGLVGAPALRAIEPPEMRQRLFRDIGLRFRSVGWWMITVLVVTGFANLHFRGWDRALGSEAFWDTPAGHALAWKLISVTIMIVVQAFHDFVHGPRANRHVAGSLQAIAARRLAVTLARVNAIVGVAVVAAAVRLARS